MSRIRDGLLILAGVLAASGCSLEMPSFLGREGGGAGVYTLQGEPAPEPVAVPLRTAQLERALHGVILRVEGVAPRQGYYAAELAPVNAALPDAAGIASFVLVAVPPEGPGQVGPERTRILTAAVFVPNRALRSVRGFRVGASNGSQTLTLN